MQERGFLLRVPVLCLATALPAGAFHVSPLLTRSPSAAALGVVPFGGAQLEAPAPLQDAARVLASKTTAWTRSLARPVLPFEDLMLALVSPEAFWLLREWRRQAFGQQEAMRAALDGARQQIRAMAATTGSDLRGAAVSVRSKGLWSTFHKACVRQKAVHDVLAVRVVLSGQDPDVYAALDCMRERWPAVAGRFKDYVARPKANGYQGLHDTLLLPCGRPFEVQVRTQAMHREAEFGQAAHRGYKGAVSQLSEKMITGIADGCASWPLQAQTALAVATRLSGPDAS